MVMPERHSFWQWNFIPVSRMLPGRWNTWKTWESSRGVFFHRKDVPDAVDVLREKRARDIPVKDVFHRMDFKTWARCGKL